MAEQGRDGEQHEYEQRELHLFLLLGLGRKYLRGSGHVGDGGVSFNR